LKKPTDVVCGPPRFRLSMFHGHSRDGDRVFAAAAPQRAGNELPSSTSRHWRQCGIALHFYPRHYSKTFIGYLLNGVYASNWQPWRIRHYTLASHLTLLNCFDAMNPYELCDLPLLFCSLFHDAILSLARVPFESLRQRSGTHFPPIFVILHHSLLFVGISKHTIFS